jgi:hypothetical protein
MTQRAGVEHLRPRLGRRLLRYGSAYDGDVSGSGDLRKHRDGRGAPAVEVFGVAWQGLHCVGAAPDFLKYRDLDTIAKTIFTGFPVYPLVLEKPSGLIIVL